MRAAYAVQGIGFLLLAGALIYIATHASPKPTQNDAAVPDPSAPLTTHVMQPFTLRSPAFPDGEPIPAKYTCDSDNILPPLALDGIPENTVSLAFIMEDPDVPKNLRPDGMWDHWLVWNIAPATTRIGEGEEPDGVHGSGTAGGTAYKGPCPPDREHRYFFKVYALDTMLDLPEGATKAQLLGAMEGHIISSTELIGRYERKGH